MIKTNIQKEHPEYCHSVRELILMLQKMNPDARVMVANDEELNSVMEAFEVSEFENYRERPEVVFWPLTNTEPEVTDEQQAREDKDMEKWRNEYSKEDKEYDRLLKAKIEKNRLIAEATELITRGAKKA